MYTNLESIKGTALANDWVIDWNNRCQITFKRGNQMVHVEITPNRKVRWAALYSATGTRGDSWVTRESIGYFATNKVVTVGSWLTA